jgi:hypothetical protein
MIGTIEETSASCGYLTAVFEIVMVWAREGKAISRAHRALHLRGYSSVRELEPFAAIIRCTSDPDRVNDRTRSKWSRVLRYAAEYKDLDESLRDFIKRRGGINKCAARFARRLGRYR